MNTLFVMRLTSLGEATRRVDLGRFGFGLNVD